MLRAQSTYNGAVSDLQGLKQMKSQLSSALAQQEASTSDSGMVDLPRAVRRRQRGPEIREDTCHADIKGLLGHIL